MKMIKDLDDKAFKYYIYVEYYNAVLDLVQRLGSEKISNIIFNKELQISKEYLIQKNKKGVQTNYLRQLIFKDILDLLI